MNRDGKGEHAPILVTGAMACEYLDLVARLEGVVREEIGNHTFYKGRFDGHPVVVANTLMGMVNAAVAITMAILRYRPGCVVVQGTAGGHHPELHRGDIILGENLVYMGGYSSAHRGEGAGSDREGWRYPGAEIRVGEKTEYSGILHSDEGLLAIAEGVPYDGGALRRGTIGSGDAWNREIDLIRHYHDRLGTDCEEMEGFAAAQVCRQFSVPMLSIRIISNSELHPEERFTEEAGVTCQAYCERVIRAIARWKG